MRVNELARQASISPHVIRFYARTGLLKPSRNPANGYKVFGQNEVKRLRLIRMAQCLGYSLADIGKMLHRLEDGETPCDLMETILRERLKENRKKIELFEETQALMERALGCLENRSWDSASNMEALCGHFETLMSEK